MVLWVLEEVAESGIWRALVGHVGAKMANKMGKMANMRGKMGARSRKCPHD